MLSRKRTGIISLLTIIERGTLFFLQKKSSFSKCRYVISGNRNLNLTYYKRAKIKKWRGLRNHTAIPLAFLDSFDLSLIINCKCSIFERGRNMGLLIIRLLSIINTANIDSLTYHIANALLENYDLIPEISIGEIAKKINVSKSSISKFARQIGFDDYSDLKDNAGFVENRYGNRLNYLTNINEKLEKNQFEEYFEAINQDVMSLKESINLDAIERFAQYLVKYKKVGAFGLLFSETAAIDFQFKLAYTGKFIRSFQTDLNQQKFIKEADEETLIIVFTNSGNFLRNDQLRIGTPTKKLFRQSKGKIIAISADINVKQLDFVDDAIIFSNSSEFQTHQFMFQIIMDLIVSKYRKLVK